MDCSQIALDLEKEASTIGIKINTNQGYQFDESDNLMLLDVSEYASYLNTNIKLRLSRVNLFLYIII